MFRPAVLGLIALLGASCSGLPRAVFEAPTVELTSVEVSGLGLTGGSLTLHLDVYNPNGYEIQSTRLEASIELDDTHFGDVDLNRPIDLAARGTTSVEVPLSFSWSGVGAGARSLLSRGAVQYLFAGTMLVGTPLGERGVTLRTGGDVTMRDLVP